jgi:outer membrane protein
MRYALPFAALLCSCLAAPALVGAAAETPVPLTVDAAVARALRDNPTLAMARSERNVALIEADRNRPALRPEVTATASQIVRGPRVDLPGRRDDVVLPNSISRLELGLRQPVFQFGAGDAPGKRANAMAAAARSDYRKAELDTVLQVREAYVVVLRTRALGSIAAQAVELARANATTTRLLEERGLQAQVDVLEADRALAEAESQALQAENGAALARANLNRLLGASIDAPIEVLDLAPVPVETGSLQALTVQAMQRRPEAETLRRQIEVAEAGIRLAKASRLPRVTLDVAYALQTETALVPRSGIAAGVSISAPIFSGAAQRYTVREAEERVGQLKSAVMALEGGVSLEIQQQLLAMTEARGRLAASERAVAAADKAYEISRARLELGRAVQLEILNARLSLQRSRSIAAEAQFDLQLAKARLARAVGEGAE